MLFALPAAADTYPSRPVRILVPFAAGASTDGLARILAEGLQRELNGTFIVDNRPGAFGMIAANATAKADPDGYTVMIATNTTHSASPNLYKAVAYDPVRDFSMIALVASGQNILAVTPSLPVRSVAELIALAKAKPGTLSYGSNSGASLVASELFKHMAGIDIVSVPYSAIGPQINDILAGRLSMVILDQLNAAPLVNDGRLRGLAVTGETRSGLVPTLPTLQEAGLAGFRINSWIGIAGPAAMPPALVVELNRGINRIVGHPSFAQRLSGFGYEPIVATPEQATAFMAQQLQHWAGVIRTARIEKE